MIKEKVEGIILIVSCQKYLKLRVELFKLNRNYYNNWKVIYVVGDFSMKKNYELVNDNFLYIKCEDSYIHLLKKVSLSLKYVYELFEIKQGILRCGDDLVFSVSSLVKFLNSENKHDYYGQATYEKEGEYFTDPDKDEIKLKHDNFMLDYYINHESDFQNAQHGLENMSLSVLKNMTLIPDIVYAYGIVYYVSNNACKTIVDFMESINYNVFYYEEKSNSYPYIIEDVGIGYILQTNKFKFVNKHIFFGKSAKFIAKHTNKYK